jgi:hypothetical protein
MTSLFYAVNTLAMLAFSAAIAFAFFAARAGAVIHHRIPASISVFMFLIPATAFLVSLFVAWRCTRDVPPPGLLVVGLICAAVAAMATTTLLALAVELTVRREIPDAIPMLVGIAFIGVASLFAASALNLTLVARALVAGVRGS